MPRICEGGELVLDAGGSALPTPDDLAMVGAGAAHADRPPTSMPYDYQDTYQRTHTETPARVAVLDNGLLRAEFLLDLGGRLWSLLDLSTGRELLHRPEPVHVANLALRNAWFAGGVEWNLGVTGHWGLTCAPVAAEIIPGERGGVLRMWAHERILDLTWQLDVWLPSNQDALYVHATIRNPHDRDQAVYWWSNIAVPQDGTTRVLVDASTAFHFGYEGRLREVTVPGCDGLDVSYPERHHGAADYFYRLGDGTPWIAALDGQGIGLAESSTSRLRGRKMFTWGGDPGGRTWQRWLSDQGSYFEIQAGLATTQLEHLRLAARKTWRFTECFRPVRCADMAGPYRAAVTRVRGLAVDEEALADADHYLTAMSDVPATQPADDPWGALEVAAGHQVPNPATPFAPHSLGPEQQAWLRVATECQVAPELATSALVTPEWREHLADCPPGWTRELLLGHAVHAAGNTNSARELWSRSIEERESADALRALGLTETDPDVAADLLVRARGLAPARPRIAVEAATALLAANRPGEALDLLDGLEAADSQLPRVDFLRCRALVATGRTSEATELIERPLVLPDLREGELGLDTLWGDYQRLAGTNEPLPAHYDFRMAGPKDVSTDAGTRPEEA